MTQSRPLAFFVRLIPNISCNWPLIPSSDTHRQLGISNGAIFAVPIPEEYESVGQELQRAVEQAIQEAEANGVSRRGKEATPWLLKRVGELTSGKSLRSSQCDMFDGMRWRSNKFGFADVALIENTATVGQ